MKVTGLGSFLGMTLVAASTANGDDASTAITANVPIASSLDGFVYGGNSTFDWNQLVVIEAFYDLMCPYSKANWPILKEVVAHYNDAVKVVVHTFPLPYHPQAFRVAQASRVVVNATDNNRSKFFDFMELIYANQEDFGTKPTLTESGVDVIDGLAELVASNADLGVDADAFKKGMNSSDLNMATRADWKRGTSLGVSGTPTFRVNGIAVNVGDDSKLKDWKAFIDPILYPKEESD